MDDETANKRSGVCPRVKLHIDLFCDLMTSEIVLSRYASLSPFKSPVSINLGLLASMLRLGAFRSFWFPRHVRKCSTSFNRGFRYIRAAPSLSGPQASRTR